MSMRDMKCLAAKVWTTTLGSFTGLYPHTGTFEGLHVGAKGMYRARRCDRLIVKAMYKL